MPPNKEKAIRISCLTALIAAASTMAADVILGSGPVSGKEMTLAYAAAHTPYISTLIGALLGSVITIPLWSFILIPLFFTLKPAGMGLTVPILLLFGLSFTAAAINHGAYAFYSAGHYALSRSGPALPPLLSQMMDKMLLFKRCMEMIWFLLTLGGTLLYTAALWFKPTPFRKWMVLGNPLLSIPLVLISLNAPAPLGGYLVPTAGAVAMFLFFLTVTKAAWNHRDGGA